MNSKDKENLSYLYETEQYKSLVKLGNQVRRDISEKLLVVDMTQVNADKTVSFLQGQAFAIKSLQVKVQELHKKSMKE